MSEGTMSSRLLPSNGPPQYRARETGADDWSGCGPPCRREDRTGFMDYIDVIWPRSLPVGARRSADTAASAGLAAPMRDPIFRSGELTSGSKWD
jgi:hypothetical protein